MHRKDRLVPLVWVAFGPLGLLTAIFGPLLVIMPGTTRGYWAWEIKPDMSAVWVGAAYTFGALAIAIMLRAGSARAVMVPVMATWVFSIVMLIGTLLHLDRFFVNSLAFYVWLAIYLVLPVLLPIMWWLNRRADPGLQDEDVLVPPRVAVAGITAGVLAVVGALVLVVSPATAARVWPWQLTPLMSQVVGGWVLFAAVGLLCLFFERRYAAYRNYLPAAAAWMAILLAGSLLHLADFSPGRAATYVWFALLGGAVASLLATYAYLEARRRRFPRAAPEVGPETL